MRILSVLHTYEMSSRSEMTLETLNDSEQFPSLGAEKSSVDDSPKVPFVSIDNDGDDDAGFIPVSYKKTKKPIKFKQSADEKELMNRAVVSAKLVQEKEKTKAIVPVIAKKVEVDYEKTCVERLFKLMDYFDSEDAYERPIHHEFPLYACNIVSFAMVSYELLTTLIDDNDKLMKEERKTDKREELD